MIRCFQIDAAGLRPVDFAAIADGPPKSGFHWIDCDGSDPAEERHLATRYFALGPESMAEFEAVRHPPKLEFLDDDRAFLMLRGLDPETESLDFGTIQIAMLVGPGVLLTRHTGRSVSIDAVLGAWAERVPASVSPWSAVLTVADRVFSRFLPIVLAVEQRLEALEDELFETARPSDDLLAELTSYRTSLKRLRRITAYHLAAVTPLLDEEIGPLGDDSRSRRIARECVDNLDRVATLQALFHDLCGDLIDSYLALAAHRLNDIMRILTIVTAIFVPLGFLAGVYGMNFDHMPELHWRRGYFMLLSLMLVIALSLVLLFRRRRWL